jgi:hypothetical protein
VFTAYKTEYINVHGREINVNTSLHVFKTVTNTSRTSQDLKISTFKMSLKDIDCLGISMS